MNYPMPPQGPRSPWASPAVIVALVVGVLVLIGGVAGALVNANSQSDDDTTAASSSCEPSQQNPSRNETVTVTQQPTQQPTAPGGGGTTGQPTTPTTTAHPSPPVSGADWQGFSGSAARCNADDAAVFVGYTGRSQVVICQVGAETGRYYYKGAADGGSIEIGYPTRSGNTFTAVNDSTTYQVSPATLVISQPSESPHVESMIEAWVN